MTSCQLEIAGSWRFLQVDRLGCVPDGRSNTSHHCARRAGSPDIFMFQKVPDLLLWKGQSGHGDYGAGIVIWSCPPTFNSHSFMFFLPSALQAGSLRHLGLGLFRGGRTAPCTTHVYNIWKIEKSCAVLMQNDKLEAIFSYSQHVRRRWRYIMIYNNPEWLTLKILEQPYVGKGWVCLGKD